MCYTERLDSMFFKEKWLRSVRTRQRKGRFAAAPQGRRGQDASREASIARRRFEMPEDMVHASDTIEAGWLVVRGRWYEQVQRSPRG